MRKLLDEFKEFINQGNIIELAVAFILGLKIKDVIDALVNNIIMPVIGAIFGKPSFDDLHFEIGDGVVQYGLFINAVLNFLIIGAALFLMVKAYNTMKERTRKPAAEEAPELDEKDVLIQIRDLLAQQNRP